MPRHSFHIGPRSVVGAVLLVAAGVGVVILTHRTPSHAQPSGIVVSTIPSQAGATSALTDVCSIDFVEVQAAVQNYQQRFHHRPASGTAWIIDIKVNGVQAHYWPTGLGFALSWNGAAITVQPTGGTPSTGNAGSSLAHSGCYGVRLP